MTGGSWEEFMREFMKGPKYHTLMDRGKPHKDTKLRSQMVGFTCQSSGNKVVRGEMN